jgi:hypothetical protein
MADRIPSRRGTNQYTNPPQAHARGSDCSTSGSFPRQPSRDFRPCRSRAFFGRAENDERHAARTVTHGVPLQDGQLMYLVGGPHTLAINIGSVDVANGWAREVEAIGSLRS